MRTMKAAALALAAGLAGFGHAQAQDTIKIGVILPFTGQFADTGVQLDNGIKLYMEQNGDTVAGKKIEIIRKDVGGIAPEVAKRLAQELVVRDKVDILAGFALTPNALAAAAISDEAKKFMVVMNAATSIITTKSPYMARVSMTTPMVNEVLGEWAFKNGVKEAYTINADYGPGNDAQAGFQRAFEAAGGKIVGAPTRCRSPTRISHPSCNVPRTPIRKASGCSSPAARSPLLSARRFPSAA